MRIVKQFQYFPETKQDGATLVILDSEGDIWLRYNPLIDGSQWHQVVLPDEFYKEVTE